MIRDIKRASRLAAAGGLVLLATASLGHGEVSRSSAPPPAPAPQEERALVPPDTQGLRTQCWQEGIRIIDQAGLQGLALNETLKQQALTFQGAGGSQPRTLILPLADALCLIQADR
jgi:hypothetical protein